MNTLIEELKADYITIIGEGLKLGELIPSYNVKIFFLRKGKKKKK